MSLAKAIDRLTGKAAQAVQDEERQRQYEMMMKLQAQQAPSNMEWQRYQQLANTNTTTSAAANAQGLLGQAFGQAAAGAASSTWIGVSPLLGGAPGAYSHTATTYNTPKLTIEFTDEQRESFMSKLADLLTKGWECLRCHRIWSPQVTGCEFCNFIDRLEGKDVDRDTAA